MAFNTTTVCIITITYYYMGNIIFALPNSICQITANADFDIDIFLSTICLQRCIVSLLFSV